MRSLDECIRYVKGMGDTYTDVGDIRTAEWYNDILNYLKMVPKITWVKVTDEVPANMDNHYVTLFLKNRKTGEGVFKVCTGWYKSWRDDPLEAECGHWYLSDGFEYEWFADKPSFADEDYSKDGHVVSHVVAWSKEILEDCIEPFIP